MFIYFTLSLNHENIFSFAMICTTQKQNRKKRDCKTIDRVSRKMKNISVTMSMTESLKSEMEMKFSSFSAFWRLFQVEMRIHQILWIFGDFEDNKICTADVICNSWKIECPTYIGHPVSGAFFWRLCCTWHHHYQTGRMLMWMEDALAERVADESIQYRNPVVDSTLDCNLLICCETDKVLWSQTPQYLCLVTISRMVQLRVVMCRTRESTKALLPG